MTPSRPKAWSPPEQFDEYRLVGPLGRGRSGQVYVALDTLLDRHVAVKFVPTQGETLLGPFLVEARAAARIQHPNVATLYRVGEIDGHAYLVWELVRGKSVDQLERPVPPEQVLRLAVDMVRGLAAAHRRGVLHRDIKPANTVLADTGEAKLVDFGLAQLLDPPGSPPRASRHGAEPSGEPSGRDETGASSLSRNGGSAVLGTPYFMSPEAWRGDPLDARSDLYSLGLLLYELLAGEGPFRHLRVKELAQALQDIEPRPLLAVAPAVPRGLAAVVDRCLRRDPAGRFGSAEELLAALDALTAGRRLATVPEGNPYRGLRAYDAEHRALFFGRGRALQLALERLRSDALLVVTGDSGVGKSSLCAAGVMPAVADGALEDGRRWLVGRAVPGRAPRQNVASVLGRLLDRPEDDLARAIEGDPFELGRLVRSVLGDAFGLLLYVDQLEELVTQGSGEEAAQVAQALAALGDGLPGVRVLATARSDFLSRLAGLPGFVERLPAALLLLGPMSPAEIREAIVGPAALKDGRFESEELVDELVASTTRAQGSLPLLQFTLAELWERRDPQGILTAASLASVGGVAGALARHADGVLGQLPPPERRAARAVLLRLVTIDDTRARRTEGELLAAAPQARGALEALVRGRLLVVGESPEGTTYELAHEALVGGWNTLAGWLAEEAELRALRHRLELAAAEWHRLGRRRDLLWSAPQLAELDARAPDGLTSREADFLSTSRRAASKARWWRRGLAVGVVLLAGAVWGGAQLKARRDVARAVSADLEEARASFEAARRSADELLKVRAEALAAWDARKPEEGEQAWGRTKKLAGEARAHFAEAGQHLERAMLRAPDRADVRDRYADLLLDRVLLEERAGRRSETDELQGRLALYDASGERRERLHAGARLEVRVAPEGARLALLGYDGKVFPGAEALGSGPVTVPPGAYLLEAEAPGRERVRQSLLLERGEAEAIELRLPRDERVPEGYVYMPAGEALFGSAEEEAVRAWFNAVPVHAVSTGAYLIGRHETTFAEWVEYLEDLPPEERERRRPKVAGTGFRGMLELERTPEGRWRILFQPTLHPMRAAWGESVRYAERDRRAEQDWRRMPVTGISFDDAAAYAAWLDRTRRVPGARLCTEHEWERAARGTDARLFPHGDVLAPDDANFDETYGKKPGGFGPDEVGSHPRSRSPFGVDDLTGNVWEWVRSSVVPDQAVARGGSYYFAGNTARIANRELPERSFRDLTVGLRICADWTEAREEKGRNSP